MACRRSENVRGRSVPRPTLDPFDGGGHADSNFRISTAVQRALGTCSRPLLGCRFHSVSNQAPSTLPPLEPEYLCWSEIIDDDPSEQLAKQGVRRCSSKRFRRNDNGALSPDFHDRNRSIGSINMEPV